MKISSITVLFFVVFWIYNGLKLKFFIESLKDKYNYHPFVTDYFTIKKLKKVMTKDEAIKYKKMSKNSFFSFIGIFVYAVIIYAISALFFDKKL